MPRLQARISGAITGNIEMWEVVRIDAGSILARVRHNPVGATPPPRLGAVVAGLIYYDYLNNPTGDRGIFAERGDINLVEADTDIGVDVIAKDGSIGTINAGTFGEGSFFGNARADKGSIGTVRATALIGPLENPPGAPVAISAKHGIGLVESPLTAYAAITANANGGAGDLDRLWIWGGGDFVGTVVANNLGDPETGLRCIDLSGDLHGDITIPGTALTNIAIDGTLKLGRTLKIGGSLSEFVSIAVADFDPETGFAGLEGQIIINAANAGGVFAGSVCICNPMEGGYTLSPTPYYNDLSKPIGGGAAGLAPFNLHGTDCDPPNASSFPASQTPSSILLRHYGPALPSTALRSPRSPSRAASSQSPRNGWTSRAISPSPSTPVAACVKCRSPSASIP